MLESASPTELKKMKGSNIFLIPQTNAVKRNVPLSEQIITAKLVKCGNLKATTDNEYVGSFYIDGECDSNNYGYLPFLTEQEALDFIEVEEFLQAIKYTNLDHLSAADVRAIKAIVGKMAK